MNTVLDWVLGITGTILIPIASLAVGAMIKILKEIRDELKKLNLTQATHEVRITNLEGISKDHEGRIRNIEK